MLNRSISRHSPSAMFCTSLTALLAACGGGSGTDTPSAANQSAATLALSDTASPIDSTDASNADALPASADVSANANANAGSVNLALKKNVTASSSENNSRLPALAVDGNLGTRWSSAFKESQWISVDLGSVQNINHVVLMWEAAHATAFQIQTATNGADWKTVYNTSSGSGGTSDIKFTAVNARYVKMVGIKRFQPYFYSLYEFQVFKDAATTPTPPSGGSLPTDAIFAPSSFWYQPIPANVTLHANSAGFAADFQRQVRTFYGNVAVNTDTYASPIYSPPAGTATRAVKFWDCQNKGYADPSLVAQWSAVPVPTYAKASAGTDGEMSIYQPATNTLWEFWQARNSNGQWQACWGGRMDNVKSNPGIWPGSYGTTATGLPFIGGQITAEELRRGEIRHAIGLALVEAEKPGVVSWPAQRSDGYNPSNAPNRIPEGLRFRLDPSLDVDALAIHPVAKIIAKAGQKYGFVVWDKAGAISIRMQNPLSYTALGQPNPYPALFNGTQPYALLNGIPWNRLQFMPKDYGRP